MAKSLTTMAKRNLKVLISGAGIAGPCLAYWLTRTRLDVSITIVERSPTPRVTGQSIDIRGSAVDIIKQMNLEEAIRARGTTEEGTVMLNAAGKPFARFMAGDTFTADYEILRADLSELFLDATASLDDITYVYGDHITSLDQTANDASGGGGGVDVTFHSGRRDTFDLLVGADGSTSHTRSLILNDQSLRQDSNNNNSSSSSSSSNYYTFLGQYLAFFSIPSQADDTKQWRWYNTTKGLSIMIRPHRNPATVGVYLCITLPRHNQRDPTIEAALDAGPTATKQLLHKYFEHAGWEARRVLAGMDTATDFYMTRAAQVKLPKWTSGRAVLVGDAAFATFGVGTTLAIESAYVLAGELSKINDIHDSSSSSSTINVPRALERYEAVFRPVYAQMEDLPPGYPQCAFPQTAAGLWLRDAVLWLVSKTKIHKLLPSDSGVKQKLPCYDWVKV